MKKPARLATLRGASQHTALYTARSLKDTTASLASESRHCGPITFLTAAIESILNAVVVIAVVLWLLNVFGLLGFLGGIRVGK